MPTHVYANNNEIASKAADGKSIAAFPDVCFSPPAPPVGPLPLPYPNTGEVKDTDKGTTKVFIKDKMAGMEGDSYLSKSMGDEAATQSQGKGIITSAIQGKCYFVVWSMDVKMEGKGAPRHLDMVTHNHGSQVGQATTAATLTTEMAKKCESLNCIYDKNVLYYLKFQFDTKQSRKIKYGLTIVADDILQPQYLLPGSSFQKRLSMEPYETDSNLETMKFFLGQNFEMLCAIEGNTIKISKNNSEHLSIDYNENINNVLDSKKNEIPPIPMPIDSYNPDSIIKYLKKPIIHLNYDHNVYEVAALAYGEASENAKEMVGIACAISNMVKIEKRTVIEHVEKNKDFAYARNKDKYNKLKSCIDRKDLKEINKNISYRVAINGAEYALKRKFVDFSKGAYFWDGTDVVADGDFKKSKGIRIVNPDHDVFTPKLDNPKDKYIKEINLKITLIERTVNTKKEIVMYTKDVKYPTAAYVSTNGIGRTIFWKYSNYFIMTARGGQERFYLTNIDFT